MLTSTDSLDNNYDLIVMGGGLAGLCLTRQLLLKMPQVRVLIIERRTFPVKETAFKVGESTVEIGAHYLGEELQLKKHLVDEQLPKFGLRFFFNQSADGDMALSPSDHRSPFAPQPDPFSPFADEHSENGTATIAAATEVGASDFFAAPGYQVDRGRLENHLLETVMAMGAHVVDGSRIRQVDLSEDDSEHHVSWERSGETRTTVAKWVVDASGRAAILKRKLGLQQPIDHQINAAWFRIGTQLRIDDWCADREWRSRTGRLPRRWLSTNHLLGKGYWVWIIPLATEATSIGIVMDPRYHSLKQFKNFSQTFSWLQQHEPLLAEKIEPHQDKLQDYLAMKHLGYSSKQVFSHQRWALTGEAGVFLDPLYSPGIDYIAIGNTMICHLIEQDLADRPLEPLVNSLQSTFLTLFANNLLSYQDQYGIFGNPRVMSLKYVWDYAVYWGFPALLYFNGKLTDASMIQSIANGVQEIRDLNVKMQQFFRDWEPLETQQVEPSIFIDQHDIKLLTQLNAELKDDLSDEQLKERFTRNVKILRELFAEITGRVGRSQPQLRSEENPGPAGTPAEPRLDAVFAALNL